MSLGKPSSSLIIEDEEVEEDFFFSAEEVEEAVYINIDEFIRQKLEKRPFSGEPTSDFCPWPPKGQITKCYTCAREFRSRKIYENHMLEHRQSSNTTDDKAKASNSLYTNAVKQSVEDAQAREISTSESLYLNAVEQRKEMEEALARETEVVKEMKRQQDSIVKSAEEQKSALENLLVASVHMVQDLEDKFVAAVDLSTILRIQRDEIQFERDAVMVELDNTIWKAVDLRKRDTLTIEEVKIQHDNRKKELEAAQKQVLALKSQLADSDRMIKEFKEKNNSALELLIASRKEQDELQLERDNALREAEELRQGKEDATANLQMMQLFSVFSLTEIKEATQHFKRSRIIGRGGYGNVFRGTLRNTDVAIKRLHPNSFQGHSEFQKEVDVLSRVRHPNLVTLIGICPEDSALIYEFLVNGSLEDRLAWEKNKSPPLPWQTRTRVAAEICSVLIFLHSNKPHSIIHGDLKPANVLLDANFVSKLGDFGICRVVHFDGYSTGSTTPTHLETTAKGTVGYMDPDFCSTGELAPKADIFAFGMILLQLLTARPTNGLVNEVRYALKQTKLRSILDASAGDWPIDQAQQLSNLALRCCENNRRNRPELAEVWKMLKSLKTSYGGASSSCL